MEKRNNNEQKKIDSFIYTWSERHSHLLRVSAHFKNNRISYRKLSLPVPFPHRNRILLSGLWRNQSGMCSLSGTFSDILFETSVCTVCSSTLRVVFIKPDDRTSLTP